MCSSNFYVVSKPAGSGGGGGSSAFSDLTGSPYSNAALSAALNSKQNDLGYVPENAAAKNQPGGYAGLNGVGLFSADNIEQTATRQFVTAANIATWDNKQNALGYTPENVANKGVNNGYQGLDSNGNLKAGGATGTGRLVARGDGVNPLMRLENSGGASMFSVDNAGSGTMVGTLTAGAFSTNNAASANTFSNVFGAFTIGYTGGGSYFRSTASSNATALTVQTDANWSGTSNYETVRVSGGLAASSGAGTLVGVNIRPTINQTGTANGATTGLKIDPVLTSAPNFTAIDVVSGRVKIGGSSNAGKLTVRGDGTNEIVHFEDNSGNTRLGLNNAGDMSGMRKVTASNDFETTDPTKGYILTDRGNGQRYRIVITEGVISTELA